MNSRFSFFFFFGPFGISPCLCLGLSVFVEVEKEILVLFVVEMDKEISFFFVVVVENEILIYENENNDPNRCFALQY